MAENRLNRELETRDKTVRKRTWVRPETLPSPTPEDGYEFHWVRISTRGEDDPMNISSMLRQGWEPVKAVDHPEIFVAGVESERFKDNVIIGGLMLNNFMRENDPRMPLFNERKTKVTFGTGN